jgi:hypothetical protein
MFWGGLILLFASGLLFGVTLAQAEAGESGILRLPYRPGTTLPTTTTVGWVRPYYKSDGTYVPGHYRSNPDGNPYNNYSYPGNVNPYTGRVAPGNGYGYPPRNPLNESPAGLEFMPAWPSQRR